MRRTIVLLLIYFFSGFSIASATPLPANALEGADTSYEVDYNNQLKEKKAAPQDGVNDVLDASEENPINFDASSENIKDENFKPTERVIQDDTSTQVVEQEKKGLLGRSKKKEEPKQEEPEKNPLGEDNPIDSSGIINEPEVEADPIPTAPKTYTQEDYEQIYRDMQVPTFTFVHGVDPDQYYDMKDTTWSPYPLLRLNAPLYFKTIAIEPGYYLLTPRKYKDDWYLLFKEAGKVKYTIPVFAKDYTPENYYRDNLPELDMTKSQRWQIKFLNAWGKYVRSSKRKPPVKTNVELTDLDNNFLLIEIYYGAKKYSTLFRTEKF